MPHRIVMVTSSYPRFGGDHVGGFLAPLARGLVARGHEVHVVAPWHPRVRPEAETGGVRLHWFRYAPGSRWQIFGHAEALEADVRLRRAAWVVAPFAAAAAWRLARRLARRGDATIVHGHWVVPGGVVAAAAAEQRPLVVSLHGSDVYVAERYRLARLAARWAWARAAWVTACSQNLADRAVKLGARPDRIEVVPYGVDTERFTPDPSVRARVRARLGIDERAPLIAAAGRLVRKKGFEYLIDAVARLAPKWPALTVALAGDGDLGEPLRRQAAARGIADRIRFLGVVSHEQVPDLFVAADLVVVPSVRDEAGNVDGLPNVAMEALASGTPLVATPAGGIGDVATHDRTALLVPERDADALARAIETLLRDPERRRALGERARADVGAAYDWSRIVARFEALYDRAREMEHRRLEATARAGPGR